MSTPNHIAPPPKSIFKSKIALAGALTAIAGAVGNFYPELQTVLATHATTILLAVGLINVALRLVTKGRVVLVADT